MRLRVVQDIDEFFYPEKWDPEKREWARPWKRSVYYVEKDRAVQFCQKLLTTGTPGRVVWESEDQKV